MQCGLNRKEFQDGDSVIGIKPPCKVRRSQSKLEQ